MRALARWSASGLTVDLVEGLAYLGGALVLGAAVLLLHRDRSLAAARLAIAGWLATTIAVGLTAETLAALGLTPAALAVAIGLSTVFDARSVLRWTLPCSALWAAIVLARSQLYPAEIPHTDLRLLLIVVPTAMLLIVGLAARAAVRGRELARSAARTARVALAERQAELMQSNVELTRRSGETVAAQSAADAAAQASKAKSAFLAHMSHELRTPLNAILGYVELVRDEAGERGMSQIVADAERMETAGRHLLQLIGDILDISKIEAGQLRLDPVRFDLAQCLRELVETMEPAIQRRSNTLLVEVLLGDDRMVVGDPVCTRQIVFNLLANAAKFTEHGEIGLAVHREGPWLVLRVADSGIGMTSEQIGRVFEPFEQADAATARRYGGTGLGLTITLGLLKLMGGVLTVDSAPGVGTVFLVKIPADITAARPTPGSPPAPQLGERSVRFSTLRARA
jgi:signal transduction histidine kinase